MRRPMLTRWIARHAWAIVAVNVWAGCLVLAIVWAVDRLA